MQTPSVHDFELLHHGASHGVTGSCHELRLPGGAGVLVDCGLFQGQDAGAGPEIEFPVGHLKALVVTHVHLDHVGRIPYLLAAGFRGPIYCSRPSAVLLPLVLEDAIKVGVTRDPGRIRAVVNRVREQTVPVGYGRPTDLDLGKGVDAALQLAPAGHILGSAQVRLGVRRNGRRTKVVFSGDLGAPYTPLLPAPRSPYAADFLVLESTYGDRLHQGRKERREALQAIVERALADGGTVLIPAFSIGRTQELLYELEGIRHHTRGTARGRAWNALEIIVDSPLASRFTAHYRGLKAYWDAEARRVLRQGRHPLSFDGLHTVDSHAEHQRTVARLADSGRPAVVVAASGMCAGGRIVNYLKAMLGNSRHDVVFIGYQARGTPGRDIQEYGPRGGWVDLDGRRYPIRARIHTLSGYSAHADQRNLVNYVKRMRRPPGEIRLVHGEEAAKGALRKALERLPSETAVVSP